MSANELPYAHRAFGGWWQPATAQGGPRARDCRSPSKRVRTTSPLRASRFAMRVRVQMRSADSRRGQSRTVVAGPGPGRHRLCGLRPFALPPRQKCSTREIRSRVGGNKLGPANAARDVDRGFAAGLRLAQVADRLSQSAGKVHWPAVRNRGRQRGESGGVRFGSFLLLSISCASATRHHLTPYHGAMLRGVVGRTYLRGRIAAAGVGRIR